MRLKCPNCGAQYEVPDDAVPPEGRDVQCSNCGHAWYFEPPVPVAAPREALTQEPVDEDARPWDGIAPPDAGAGPRVADHGLAAAIGGVGPARASLSEGAARVLRDEAERSAARRRTDRTPLETQAELGLSASATRATEQAAGLHTTSRRELLPDIEEINSSLMGSREPPPEPMPDPEEKRTSRGSRRQRRRRRGFRLGFFLSVVLIAASFFTYTRSADLISLVPAYEGAIAAYVERADDFRFWLEGAVQRLSERLEAAAG